MEMVRESRVDHATSARRAIWGRFDEGPGPEGFNDGSRLSLPLPASAPAPALLLLLLLLPAQEEVPCDAAGGALCSGVGGDRPAASNLAATSPTVKSVIRAGDYLEHH